jgi:hypothetical protein
MEHISTSINALYGDVFERSVRRLDTMAEQGIITRAERDKRLKHMVEAAS